MNDFKLLSSSTDEIIPQPLTISPEESHKKHSLTPITQVKTEIAKHFLEQNFQNYFNEARKCRQRHVEFKNNLQNGSYTKKEKKNLAWRYLCLSVICVCA